MLIILALYFGLVWLVFFKLHLVPWNIFTKSLVYFGALIIALVVVGALNHTTPTGPVSVQGIATNIAPNVAGTVVEVPVKPNQKVKKGDLLFRIDQTPFEIEVARRVATLESAKSSADQLNLDLKATEAEIDSLEAQLAFGVQRRDDIVELEQRGASTTFKLQEAISTIEQLTAGLRAAEARKDSLIRRISAQVDGKDVAVEEAEQALAQAKWKLEQTEVRAPADGVVSAVTLQPGNRATTFQGAMTFVAPENRRMVASLPQSSRENVSVGDEIRIALRTLPGREFTARITEISVGTAEGVQDLRSGLPTMRQLLGVTSYPILIDIPDDVAPNTTPMGASGTALVITEKAGAVAMLAKILFWVTKQLNYL